MTLDDIVCVAMIITLIPIAVIQWMSLIVAIIERLKE